MPGMTERVYPNEIDDGNEFHNLIIDIFRERYEKAAKWISEWIPNRPLRILDIACGSGYGSEILSSLGSVVGVDIDSEVVEYAQENHVSDNISFLTGSADDGDFLDTLGEFDAVVSMSTLEHIERPDIFFGWIKRSLTPGGVSVFNFPAMVTRDWAGDHHTRDIPVRKADAFMGQHGFEIKKRFIRKDRLRLKHIVRENMENEELPSPDLKQFFLYYLTHPHVLFFRLYQVVVHRGIYFSGQQYLIVPTGGNSEN